jgi:hypothetical protein
MAEPRRRPPHGPRRVRRLDTTNLCLLFAAALACLPWLFASDTTDAQSPPRNAAKAVAVGLISPATNHGAAT